MKDKDLTTKGESLGKVISCVVDNHPKFLMQVWNLACSLIETGDWPKPDVEFFVHYTDAVDPQKLATLARLGAKLRPVHPWGPGIARYCNKLRQLETPELQSADVAILLDADVVVAKPLAPLLSSTRVRGKIVDAANPPEDVWKALLKGTVFEGRDIFDGTPSMDPEARTPATNFNGGVYVLPQAAIAVLKSLWPKWTNFCLDHAERLGDYAHHADQIGFALAMQEAELAFEPLSLGQNFPLHFSPEAYRTVDPCDLSIIHYHWQMNDHGLPKPIGIAWIDAQVQAVSERIATQRRQAFDNVIFWDFRYDAYPELGSGIGSRGDVLAYKRARLAPFIQLFATRPVLDLGCGDLETTRYAAFENYTGLDLSETALAQAKGKRPDWHFSTTPAEEVPARSAALVLCLDVLIHQPTANDAQALVNQLVRIATDAVIVSGHQSVPDCDGIVFSHPPVIEMLEAHPEIQSVVEIGNYRGLSLAVAQKRSLTPVNASDIGIVDLAWGMAHCPTPKLLADLVQLSREHFTFFPKTITRTIEYPWIASRLRDCAGLRILDLGAGVSVLPLWLAASGALVTTVDNHPIRRDPQAKLHWNEWGFLDFASFDQRIVSHQQDMQVFTDEQGFDRIYSASVIEHMPATARRATIARLSELLRPEGRLLLTLDLVPGTSALWPLSEGQEVDPPGTHGDLTAIVQELETAGFEVFEETILRRIPNSRTDIVMLDLRLKDRPM